MTTATRPPADRARRQLAARFQALSDPTRLAILERLRQGERCVCDLTDLLDAAQSRLSFHLRVLRQAGLIRQRRHGRWMYYALEPVAFADLAEALHEVIADEADGPGADGCC
jgi:ArsR family transcriptional regulator